jgi:serine/threonine protein kinase
VSALDPGVRLGPYEILAFIGAGAMGEVYRARDPRLGRDVAIKVLPVAFSGNLDRLHRFEQEARAAAALNHPSILTVHDIGSAQRIDVDGDRGDRGFRYRVASVRNRRMIRTWSDDQ